MLHILRQDNRLASPGAGKTSASEAIDLVAGVDQRHLQR
jgi:hypothetical protein